MTETSFIERFENLEEKLILRFKNHSVLSSLRKLTNNQFEEILIQRAFLSILGFTPFYDLASVGIENKEAKDLVKNLIREEYPIGKSSHREDLMTDLQLIGIKKEKVLGRTPSQETIISLYNLYELVKFGSPHYDVKAITALRMAGEVLVAEEYDLLIKEIKSRYKINPKELVFYYPHFVHDRKSKGIGLNKTHSDRLLLILKNNINSKNKLEAAIDSMEEALKVKNNFYNQFIKE